MSNITKYNVFQLRGINNTNKARLKLAGYITDDNQYDDEEIILDINTKATTKEIMDTVFVKMYKCRMTDGFVSSHKKLPLMYASIFYQKKFVTGYLFSVYIYFDIETDTKKFKTLRALTDSELDGKYTLEIVMDKKTEVIDLDKFMGYERTIDYLLNIIQSDEIKNIIQIELKHRDEERRKQFGKLLDSRPKEPSYNFSELLNQVKNGNDVDEVVNKAITIEKK